MPLFYTRLEKRLAECDERLENIFKNMEEAQGIQSYIKNIQEYYALSYKKAKQNEKTIENIIKRYEYYVQSLELASQGEMPGDIKTKIHTDGQSRVIAVFLADTLKACELIFWAATAVTLYASIFLFALPMLLMQTPLGIGISIAIGGLLIQTAVNCVKCCTEFRTIERHDKEYKSELELLSFFQPAAASEPSDSENQKGIKKEGSEEDIAQEQKFEI